MSFSFLLPCNAKPGKKHVSIRLCAPQTDEWMGRRCTLGKKGCGYTELIRISNFVRRSVRPRTGGIKLGCSQRKGCRGKVLFQRLVTSVLQQPREAVGTDPLRRTALPSVTHCWPLPKNIQPWKVSRSCGYFRSTKLPAVLGVPSVGGREGGERKPTDSFARAGTGCGNEGNTGQRRTEESHKGCCWETSSRSWKRAGR